MRQRSDKTVVWWLGSERARQVPIEVVWSVARGSSGEWPENGKDDGKEGLVIGRTEERAERLQKLKQYAKSLLS